MTRSICVSAAILTMPSFALADTTVWTGGAGNGLWGDAANWDSGVPDAARAARFNGPATVDLSGMAHPVGLLEVGPAVRISNGTLVLDRMTYESYASSAYPVVEASLTTQGPRLELFGDASYSRRLTIAGSIIGDGFVVAPFNVDFTGVSTYTGATVVDQYGTLNLAGSGRITNTSAIEVGPGLLLLNNQLMPLSDRLNDSAPISISGGFRVSASASAPVDERIGPIIFRGGSIDLGSGFAGEVTLRAPSLHVEDGRQGIVSVQTADQRLLLDKAPSMIGGAPGSGATARGVIPELMYWSRSASLTIAAGVTYDAGPDDMDPSDDVGLRALNPLTEYEQVVPSSPAASAPNVRVAGPQTVLSAGPINSLWVDGARLQLDAELIVESGVISLDSNASAASIEGTGSIRVPGRAFLRSDASFDAMPTVAVPIHAQSMLVTSAVLSAPNSIPGRVTVTSGNTIVTSPGALGTGTVRLDSGGLAFSGQDHSVSNRLEIAATNTLAAQSGTVLTLEGHLSGSGNVSFGEKGYSGLLRFNGDADFETAYLWSYAVRFIEINGTLRSSISPEHLLIDADVRGNGTILGTVRGGTLSAGPDGEAGRITVAHAQMYDLIFDLDGAEPGTSYDQLVVLGSIHGTAQNGSSNLIADLSFSPPLGQEFLIIDSRFDGPMPFPFRTYALDGSIIFLNEGAILNAGDVPLQISYTAGDGNDVSLTVVPEPSPALLSVLGASLLWRRRRI